MSDQQINGSTPISTVILRRRIIRVAVVGILAAASLVAAATMTQSILRLADAQHEKLVHSAQLTAQSIHELLKRTKVIAKLSANRFQAKQFLTMYNMGQIDADTVNSSTSTILSDLILNHESIRGLVRLDLTRRVAAAIGTEIPESDWPAAAFSAEDAQIGPLREVDGQVHFTVSAPILDPYLGRIGTDVMVIDAAVLLGLLRPAENVDGQATYLAIPSGDQFAYLSSAGFVSPEGLAATDVKILGNSGFVSHGDLEIGLAPVGINGWRVLEATEYGQHFIHVWNDVAKVVLLALVATGVVGIAIYAIMTPLAQGLVVRAETLEAEVAQRTKDLNASEDRFRGFAEAASDWFWETDPEHRFVFVSDAIFLASGGLVTDRILGKTRWEVPRATPASGDWSEHRAQMEAREPISDFEYEIDGKDGIHRVLSIRGRPRFDESGAFLGYRGTGRNVTELRRAQRERERSQRLFLDAITTVPVAIALFDSDDRIIVWNRLYADQIAKGVKLAEGMTFQELVRLAVSNGRIAEATGHDEEWLEHRIEQHRNPAGSFEICLDGDYLEIREHRTHEGYTILIGHDITQAKTAEANLRRQKALLETVLETIPHAVYWKDRNLVYRGANSRFAKTYGFGSGTEIVGKTLGELLPVAADAVAIEDWDRQVLDSGEAIINAEAQRTLSDGTVSTHLSSKVPWVGPDGMAAGVLGVFTDITDRKRMEQRLAENEARIRALFEGVSVGITVVDAEFHAILEVNPVAADMIGLPPDQIVGEDCEKFILSAGSDKHPTMDIGENAETSECWVRRTDGAKVPILKTVRRLSLDGKECLLESFFDISEIKRAQEMVRKAQKLESLGNLAAGLAHELNNLLLPIGTLSGMTLRRLPDDSPERPKVEKIKEASDRAAAIVAQVTEFGAADQAELAPVNLPDVIRGALDLLRSELPPNVTVKRRFARNTKSVMANSAQMSALVSNLVSNAVDAFDGQPGQLTVKLSEQTMLSQTGVGATELPAGRYLRLEVTDTGRGMEPETLERAFDPFFTTKEVGEGTGLGLSMVHGIVERQGGAVEISSEIGKGTTVSIYFPVSSEDFEASGDLAVSNG